MAKKEDVNLESIQEAIVSLEQKVEQLQTSYENLLTRVGEVREELLSENKIIRAALSSLETFAENLGGDNTQVGDACLEVPPTNAPVFTLSDKETLEKLRHKIGRL